MRKLLTILFVLLALKGFSQPVANAGSDQTIYLTSTSTASLNGGSSTGTGLSYQWREVSTDYNSGGTITTPTSVSTIVTGLPQGVFYFELAVTDNVDRTSVDTVKVTVNYANAPGTLLYNFPLSDANVVNVINNRSDTVGYYSPSTSLGQVTDANNHTWYLFRDRLNGLYIDPQRGKLKSTIEDGYAHETSDGVTYYSRSEIQLAEWNLTLDTTKTYCFEWKGYYPQDTNYINTNGAPNWATILNMFQIHSYTQVTTVMGMNQGIKGNVYEADNTNDSLTIGYISDFYHKAHTLRFYIKEGKGYTGQTAYIKLYEDGNLVFSRDTGQVGSDAFDDYVKFAGLYDWRNWITSPDSLARGRKYSLITEGFNVYDVTGQTVAAPTISMGGNQSITVNNTSVSASATWASGHSGTYKWQIISGGSGTITSPTSSNTTITGLSTGTYDVRCTATQDDGQTVYGDVTITVSIAHTGKGSIWMTRKKFTNLF